MPPTCLRSPDGVTDVRPWNDWTVKTPEEGIFDSTATFGVTFAHGGPVPHSMLPNCPCRQHRDAADPAVQQHLGGHGNSADQSFGQYIASRYWVKGQATNDLPDYDGVTMNDRALASSKHQAADSSGNEKGPRLADAASSTTLGPHGGSETCDATQSELSFGMTAGGRQLASSLPSGPSDENLSVCVATATGSLISGRTSA